MNREQEKAFEAAFFPVEPPHGARVANDRCPESASTPDSAVPETPGRAAPRRAPIAEHVKRRLIDRMLMD